MDFYGVMELPKKPSPGADDENMLQAPFISANLIGETFGIP